MITKKLNLNTVLLAAGALALFAPDVAAVAAWLSSLGLSWLVLPTKVLAAVALLLSSLPRIIGRLRPVLAALGLATPNEPQALPTVPYDVEVTGPPARQVPLGTKAPTEEAAK